LLALGDEPGESPRVDPVRIDGQEISRRAGHDEIPTCAQRAPQSDDDSMQRIPGISRGVISPQKIHQPVRGDHDTRRGEQRGQHDPLAYARYPHRSIADSNGERPEDTELHL
jgi:hypothetical protein